MSVPSRYTEYMISNIHPIRACSDNYFCKFSEIINSRECVVVPGKTIPETQYYEPTPILLCKESDFTQYTKQHGQAPGGEVEENTTLRIWKVNF